MEVTIFLREKGVLKIAPPFLFEIYANLNRKELTKRFSTDLENLLTSRSTIYEQLCKPHSPTVCKKENSKLKSLKQSDLSFQRKCQKVSESKQNSQVMKCIAL